MKIQARLETALETFDRHPDFPNPSPCPLAPSSRTGILLSLQTGLKRALRQVGNKNRKPSNDNPSRHRRVTLAQTPTKSDEGPKSKNRRRK